MLDGGLTVGFSPCVTRASEGRSTASGTIPLCEFLEGEEQKIEGREPNPKRLAGAAL